jgi:hypothetical protein
MQQAKMLRAQRFAFTLNINSSLLPGLETVSGIYFSTLILDKLFIIRKKAIPMIIIKTAKGFRDHP